LKGLIDKSGNTYKGDSLHVLTVEIANWDKYNPRSDVKSSSWFRMDNNFFSDPDFYGHSLTTKATWLQILACASAKLSSIVKINTKQIGDSLGCSADEILKCVTAISSIRSTEGSAILVIHSPVISTRSNPIESDRMTQSNCSLRTDGRTNVTNERNEQVLTLVNESPCVTPVEKKQPRKKTPPPTQTTWESYRSAYMQRYGVEPIRNTTVNSKIKKFVERVGQEESPEVVKFYVSHNAQRYTSSAHSVGNLLFDAEKLRTEWARGRQITASESRSTETRQQVFNAFSKHLDGNGGANAGNS
jgi:hypothetical protein